MRSMIVILLSFIAMILPSCTGPVICSEEFHIVAVMVKGDSLTDYYTVRISNKEVIQHSDFYNSDGNWYPVLTDNYHHSMIGKQEIFRFIGKIDNEIVVDEQYVIRADKCHISKVSGAEEVNI